MDTPLTTFPKPVWKRKKTYLWMLGLIGVLHGLLLVYSITALESGFGIQLFVNFTLNVVLLGWCYTDAEERLVAISGPLGFFMLLVCWIGIPWYFVRSRGLVGALKGAFGLGLFALWFVAFFVGLFSGAILQELLLHEC